MVSTTMSNIDIVCPNIDTKCENFGYRICLVFQHVKFVNYYYCILCPRCRRAKALKTRFERPSPFILVPENVQDRALQAIT
jgi:hypothetical protein